MERSEGANRPGIARPPPLYSGPFTSRAAPMPMTLLRTRVREHHRARRRGPQILFAVRPDNLRQVFCVIARHQSLRAAAVGHRLLAMVLVLCCASGCVHRRMTIRSNPPGAFVYVDDYPIGVTPCSTDFTYYGTRQFRLVREGYETLTVEKKLSAPWYQWYGVDFISENLVPMEIRDERSLDFTLVPQRLIPQEQLVANGQQLRQLNQPVTFVTPITPAPATMPPPGMPPVFTPGQGVAPLPGQPGAPVFGPSSQSPLLPPNWTPYPTVPRVAPPPPVRGYYAPEGTAPTPYQITPGVTGPPPVTPTPTSPALSSPALPVPTAPALAPLPAQ